MLAEGLKGNLILTSLKCALQPFHLCPRLFCFEPHDILHFFCTCSAMRGSLDGNMLCGINEFGRGTYSAEGINKLCESLKTSSITSLRCADTFPCSRALRVSRPAEHLHLSYTYQRLVACGSIGNNNLGVEGGKAFAEALPKSSLTSLKCATAHVLAFCVQRPLNTCPTPALLLMAAFEITTSALREARHSRKPFQSHR